MVNENQSVCAFCQKAMHLMFWLTSQRLRSRSNSHSRQTKTMKWVRSTKSLRHCIIVQNYYPFAEVRVRRDADALAEQGHSVDVICRFMGLSLGANPSEASPSTGLRSDRNGGGYSPNSLIISRLLSWHF